MEKGGEEKGKRKTKREERTHGRGQDAKKDEAGVKGRQWWGERGGMELGRGEKGARGRGS